MAEWKFIGARRYECSACGEGIAEMPCDWKAASMRQNDGNLLKSIETNAKRFGYDEQLKQILVNTAKLLEE